MAKKIILQLLFLLTAATASAQHDSTVFHAYLYNKEYNVYLRINLYQQDITIPGQELYGQLPGYLGKQHNSFCWVIANSRLLGPKKAELQLINDFGSEDLTATLTCLDDSTYVLRHVSGNTIKVPNNGKWQKLPKTLQFIRNRKK